MYILRSYHILQLYNGVFFPKYWSIHLGGVAHRGNVDIQGDSYKPGQQIICVFTHQSANALGIWKIKIIEVWNLGGFGGKSLDARNAPQKAIVYKRKKL